MYYKAINYWVLGGFEGGKNPKEAIDDASNLGLDGVELTFGEAIPENASIADCNEIKQYAEDKGIGLRTLASGFFWGCSLSSNDPAERKKAVTFAEKYLKAAANLGVETVLLIPGAVDVAWDESRPVTPYQAVWDNASNSLRNLVKLAEDLDVNIGIENVWNKFLLSPIEMKMFLEQFNSSNIGSYFDVANVLIYGYPEHWIAILEKHIKAIHIKNFARNDCGGVLHGFGESLHDGDLNYDQLKKSLSDIQYNGPLTVEMIPFSRLPNLILPDMELARKVSKEFLELF